MFVYARRGIGFEEPCGIDKLSAGIEYVLVYLTTSLLLYYMLINHDRPRARDLVRISALTQAG